jgi:hypothetical protein
LPFPSSPHCAPKTINADITISSLSKYIYYNLNPNFTSTP